MTSTLLLLGPTILTVTAVTVEESFTFDFTLFNPRESLLLLRSLLFLSLLPCLPLLLSFLLSSSVFGPFPSPVLTIGAGFILFTGPNLPVIPFSLAAAPTPAFTRLIVNELYLCSPLHLLLILDSCPRFLLHLGSLLCLHLDLHVELLLPVRLPLLLLLPPLGLLLLIYGAGSGHVVLSLAQQVLALSGFQKCPGEVVLHLVSFDCQVLEILVCDAQLVDSLQHLGESALLVPEEAGGKPLQHQGDVVKDGGVARGHAPGLQQHSLRLL